ncbi:MAG: hypothetical protein IPN46_19625 [Saprospiraceae bacterium]|nr:hypothetical protein [Saprospiraceae bacterium]
MTKVSSACIQPKAERCTRLWRQVFCHGRIQASVIRKARKKQKLGSNKSERPFTRMYFDKWSKNFRYERFEGEDGLLNFNRDREQMMNSVQLINAIDSFSMHIRENNEK